MANENNLDPQIESELKSLRHRVKVLEGVAEKYYQLKRDFEEDNSRFQHLFRNSQDIMVLANTINGQILHISDAVELYLGFSPDELIGKRFSSLFPKITEDKKAFMQHLHAYDAVLTDQPFLKKSGEVNLMDLTATIVKWNGRKAILMTIRSTTERREAEAERTALLEHLKKALDDVERLNGFLPICAHCKKIREDDGYWTQVEEYIRSRANVDFSHSICPDCLDSNYSNLTGRKG